MPRGSYGALQRRPIRQYSIDGEIIRDYECISIILAEYPDWHETGIRKCCLRSGNANSAYGFVWRYVDTDELYDLSVEERKTMIRSLISVRYYPYKVRMYTLLGEFVREYDSIPAIEHEFDFCRGKVSKCCTRKKNVRSAFGYVWRYASDDELFELSVLERQKLLFVIRQYTKDGTFVNMFDSLTDACYSVKGGAGSGITACCRRRRPTAYNFIWRLASDDEYAGKPDNITAMEEWVKCLKSSG